MSESIAERLKQAMEMRGMRNRDIVDKSRELGQPIGSSAISQWLSGKYKPKHDKLVLLAYILDVPVQWFFSPEVWLLETNVKNNNITIQERNFITLFRRLNQTGKDSIMEILKMYCDNDKYKK